MIRSKFSGSLTVEAALLMPLMIATVLSVIYLCFYIQGNVSLAANGAEAALTGVVPEMKYMAVSDPDWTVNNRKSQRSVEYQAEIFYLDGSVFGSSSGSYVYHKSDPTKELRWRQRLKEK